MTKLALAPTTLPDTQPLDYVKAAAEAGYDAIGLRLNRSPGLPFHPVVGNAPLIREMSRMIDGGGLSVLEIYSCYLEPATDVDAFRPALELGRQFGARYVLVMGADPDWARMRDNLGRFAEVAAEYALVPALEPAVTRPLASHRQCERLIAEAGSSSAVICLDPLNLVRAGEGARDIAAMDPRLFPFAQLTDGFVDARETPAMLGRMAPNRRAMLGEGNLPIAAILDALPAGIPLSVETPMSIAGGESHPSPLDWAKAALANARSFLAGYRRGRGAN
jgi:sugar phosphate isomerase/epimerase